MHRDESYNDSMEKNEKKLFAIMDELAQLAQAADQLGHELSMHEHLHDDARRDALVSGNPFDREDARITRQDVERMRREILRLEKRSTKLDAKREQLLSKLD